VGQIQAAGKLHFGGKWIKKSHSQINQPANFSEIEKK
jgi:hypothetical protein